jgi:hypothetical protein
MVELPSFLTDERADVAASPTNADPDLEASAEAESFLTVPSKEESVNA